jgi:hypothetical protein
LSGRREGRVTRKTMVGDCQHLPPASALCEVASIHSLATTSSSNLLALGIDGRTERIAPDPARSRKPPAASRNMEASRRHRASQVCGSRIVISKDPHRLSPAWVLAIIFFPEDRLYPFLAPDFVSRFPRMHKKGTVALFKISINCFLAFVY